MEASDIASRIADLPYTSPRKGSLLFDLVRQSGARRILELGIAHGGGTSYLAAAVHGLEGAHVTAVDLASAAFEPSAEDVVASFGFGDLVTVVREKSSYTWFLKKEIERYTDGDGVCRPAYDFVFVDGPKDWTNDGATFFMVDKLLAPGGVIVLDDYLWTYRGDEKRRGKKHDRGYVFPEMSDDEFAEAHVEAIFRLLVMQHPSYGEFRIINDELAVARKQTDSGTGASRTLRHEVQFDLGYRLKKVVRRLRHRRP